MFLKALEIQGFKSFPDRTKIAFDRGITSVVGPNGSGKSNISDAIRWVLGETSVKQLRGGGKMENVIFGGTQSRNAMGFASVKLVLDNSDRRLEVDADEVVIGRRYYRSGESEYSINGQSVRLRDVYELLLDTGLGRDGYSVVGQGRIGEIVSAKSTDRREIFEEASGIARYRYRKNEAERRLGSAAENLERLRDILGELEGRVGPLKKESEKAHKFLEYSAEKKKLEVTLWVDTLRSTREGLRGQQRKIETAEADLREKERQIAEIEQQTQGVRDEMERLIVEIDRRGEQTRGLGDELAIQERQVAVWENDIQRNKDSAAQMQQEVELSGDSAGEFDAEIALQNADIARAEKVLEGMRAEIAQQEQRLAQIQQQSLATGERRGQVTAQLAEATDRITALRVAEAAADSTTASAAARLEAEQQSLAAVQSDVDAISRQKAETEEFLQATTQEIAKLENIKGGLQLKLDSRKKALAEAQQAEQNAIRQEESAAHRLGVLRDLERNLDGFQASVKSVMKAAGDGKLRGIIGPVGTVIAVKDGYEVAVETALGYSLQNVVVQNEADAKAAMAYLKKTGGGRATFLPLDTVRPQRMDTSKLTGGAISAQTVVEYDKKYENIISSLLARIVVVGDIHAASGTARALDYKNRIVTQDGQVINAGGSFTGGSVSRSAGLFSRKQEIEELQAKMAELEQKKLQAKAQTAKVKAEVDALDAELVATASEAINAGGDKIRCDTELARIEQSLQVATTNCERLLAECEMLNEQIAKAKTEHKMALNEQNRLSGEIDALSAELAGISGEDDGFLAERQQLSDRLAQARLDALSCERDADMHRQRIETLKSRSGESEARRAAMQANIEQLHSTNRELLQNIEKAGQIKQQLQQNIKQIEESIEAMRGERLQKEGSATGQSGRLRQIEDERIEIVKEVARLTEQKTGMEERLESTTTQLWEEYELTISDAESMCVEFESAAQLRRGVAELRGKIRALGNVNVGAIEEYAEVSERYTFLLAQVKDVEDSKQSLEKMIAELSAEMAAIFSESFAEINRNFGRIFTELFGGGKGKLFLSNPEDLLESGIEIEVAPPGKVIKDLTSLSGGELALVAICIYFAILAVNPSPFCVLDEIEAALDETNVVRFAQYLRRITASTQFIVITHRRGSMEEADVLYGVTMQEDGVSKLLRLDVAQAAASIVE